MTITSVLKDGGRLIIVEDGITLIRSIVYDDVVCSLPPTGYTEVGVIYVDEVNNKLVIQYNGSSAEIGLSAAGDLTGAEIVALLEALTVGNRLSHTKLDDVGASDHHAKYLNSEAKAAAVQAGVITNGVTKAPTHDVVYDVKATADAAQPAATDAAAAVTAMGVKGDANPLNHDKADEWGATEHTAIGDSAPHHAKYTNGEAVSAVEAAGLAFAEDKGITLDSAMSADHKYSPVAVVSGIAGYGTTAIGQLVYLSSVDGKWELADADAEATTKPMLGIALTAVAENAALLVLLCGYIRDDGFSLTDDGAPLFVGLTAGAMVEDISGYTTGDCVRVVGHVHDASAHTVFFNPSGAWIEVA